MTITEGLCFVVAVALLAVPARADDVAAVVSAAAGEEVAGPAVAGEESGAAGVGAAGAPDAERAVVA
ncbi:hypothetical protein QT381_12510 [Galbitalea sp. SE-J8]|uniref:hypothetical protein n=1 Tax=Galbitalea sp. SE-J8 TaxID=3054952 RepID=UPI00259CDA02|nr:hypothetical protein [Galbitalea sp. SE-J8]MDM4763830.1 hypothetical protein [Galbitalea sp. SE-J8]